MLIFTILIFAAYMTQSQPAKILAIFPMPAISHQIAFRSLTQELARRGHKVTVITPDPAFSKEEALLNLEEIDIHDVTYKTWQQLFQDIYYTDSDNIKTLRHVMLSLIYLFKKQFESSQIQKLISNEQNNFDLIIIENAARSALIFSHIFKAPIILLSSIGPIITDDKITGIPSHPLLYPSPCRKKIYNLNLAERIVQIFEQYYFEYIFYLNDIDINIYLQETLGPEMSHVTINDLYNNIDMLFLNVHPMWIDNQPVPPNVIYVGGMHQVAEKNLPEDLQTYLDFSKNGVIYFSFGTSVREEMIPKDKLRILMDVLSDLPYDVLFKWSKDKLTGKQKNIKISNWYPQADLLRHPKLKLFITQAGLQSTTEAITAGVPLIVFPMLADQLYNAEKYVKHGIGKRLDLYTVTAEEFKSAVECVINNSSYRYNVRKLRKWFLDQPETPLQRAVWWTEYVIRNGGAKHLRSPAANMSFTQYFEIKVLSILFLMLVTLLIILLVSINFILKRLKFLLNKKSKKA